VVGGRRLFWKKHPRRRRRKGQLKLSLVGSVVVSKSVRCLGAETPLIVPWQVAAEFLATLRRWEDIGPIYRGDVDSYFNRFLVPLPIMLPTIGSLQRHGV
jgi:hypothetical protein